MPREYMYGSCIVNAILKTSERLKHANASEKLNHAVIICKLLVTQNDTKTLK